MDRLDDMMALWNDVEYNNWTLDELFADDSEDDSEED